MGRRRLPAKVARVSSRTAGNVGRAWRAVLAAGPGRWPGTVTEVVADGADVVVTVHVLVPARDVVSVVLTADGVALAVAASAAEAGAWRATCPRASLPGAAVELGAIVVLRSGLYERVEPAVWTLAPPPAPQEEEEEDDDDGTRDLPGWVDEPADGTVVDDGVLRITGWVRSPTEVDRVEIVIDGDRTVRARPFSVGRDDLLAVTGDPATVLAGFLQFVDLGDRAAGTTVHVAVDAVGRAGRTRLGERRAVVVDAPRAADDPDAAWVGALAARAAMGADRRVTPTGFDLVVFTHHLGLGGAQLWLWEILERVLRRNDVSCTVVAPDDGPLRAPLEAAGARVHLMGSFLTEAGRYESKVRELTHLVAAGDHTVALVNTVGAFIGVDVAHRCQLPVVFAVHDHFTPATFWASAFGAQPIDAHVRERAGRALRDADAVCFVADATRALFAGAIPADRSVTIPYGIPLDALDERRATLDRAELRAAHGYRPEDQLLVCVATIEERKAQSSLVLALARLATSHPRAQLALVGGAPGTYADAVARLAEALGLGDRVRIVPLTPDVAPWYVMADGFVLASDIESLPRSIMEAMAHEVPVLTTDAGGARELVDDGRTGFVCATCDVGALAAGLERLLDLTDAERRALVTAAARLVRERHDVSTYTARYERLLGGLAKDPGAAPHLLGS